MKAFGSEYQRSPLPLVFVLLLAVQGSLDPYISIYFVLMSFLTASHHAY